MRFEDEDKLVLSKIYDWYGVDFGEDEKELLQHLMLYTKPRMKNVSQPSAVTLIMKQWELNGFLRKNI